MTYHIKLDKGWGGCYKKSTTLKTQFEINMKIRTYNQRERDYYSENLSILNISSQWFKPVLRCKNSQNTKNYDAIKFINPPIFKIVMKLETLIPQFQNF